MVIIKVGVAVCFQISTTLLSMDDGCGLSQTLLVLVRYNNYYYCVSFETIMDFTKRSFIGWGGGGGRANLSNNINDNVDLNQVLQNATYVQVIDCLRYEFCKNHLNNQNSI